MYQLRDRFLFDAPPPSADGIKNFNLFAATADRRTFYVEAGANNGVRVLAHFDEHGTAYYATRLHASCLVRDDQDCVSGLLRRAADCCPLSELHSFLEIRLTGPSPRANRWFPSIPGFGGGDSINQHPAALCVHNEPQTRHDAGWHTHSRVILPLPAPSFAPEARTFDIREGVYLYFPDQSIRLIARREYYAFLSEMPFNSIARQGDLLFFAGDHSGNRDWEWVRQDDDGRGLAAGRRIDEQTFASVQSLDRHELDEEANVVRHPEHGEMPLPEGQWTAVLMPGTSRPFERAGGVD